MNKKKIIMAVLSVTCIASMLSACTITVTKPNAKASNSSSVSTSSVKNDTNSAAATNDSSSVSSGTSSDGKSATGSTTAPAKDKWSKSAYNTPLSKGQWGTANMYNTTSHKNEVVGVTLKNVTYGDAATKAVKDWISKQSVYKWQEPQAGFEYAVADIAISFDGFTNDTTGLGNSLDLQTGLCCKENKDYVYFNGMKYDVTSRCMNVSDYSKDKVVDTQVLMLVPKGCKKYVVSLGTTGEDGLPVAYFAVQ